MRPLRSISEVRRGCLAFHPLRPEQWWPLPHRRYRRQVRSGRAGNQGAFPIGPTAVGDVGRRKTPHGGHRGNEDANAIANEKESAKRNVSAKQKAMNLLSAN